MEPAYVTALRREREHYLQRGLADRAAEVDAELARLGYETAAAPKAPAPADVAPETTVLEAPPETTTPPRPRPRRSTPNAR